MFKYGRRSHDRHSLVRPAEDRLDSALHCTMI
jgi:hypothetical protein